MNIIRISFLRFILIGIMLNNLFCIQAMHSEKHVEWLSKINRTTPYEIEDITDGLNNAFKCAQLFSLDQKKDEKDRLQKSITDQLLRAKRSLEYISSNVEKLGVDKVPVVDRPLDWIDRLVDKVQPIKVPEKEYVVRRQLPLAFDIKSAFNFLVRDIDTILDETLTPESSADVAKIVDQTNVLFQLLGGSYNKSYRNLDFFDNKYKDILSKINQKQYKPLWKSIGSMAGYEKWISEKVAGIVHTVTKPVTVAIKVLDEIAKKPNISSLALMFLNPARGSRTAFNFIETYPNVRKALGLIGLEGEMADIENAIAQGKAPSTLVDLCDEKVPKSIKPALVSLLKNHGTAVNRSLWGLNKCVNMPYIGLTGAVGFFDDFATELQADATLPTLEDQLTTYMKSLSSNYETKKTQLTVTSAFDSFKNYKQPILEDLTNEHRTVYNEFMDLSLEDIRLKQNLIEEQINKETLELENFHKKITKIEKKLVKKSALKNNAKSLFKESLSRIEIEKIEQAIEDSQKRLRILFHENKMKIQSLQKSVIMHEREYRNCVEVIAIKNKKIEMDKNLEAQFVNGCIKISEDCIERLFSEMKNELECVYLPEIVHNNIDEFIEICRKKQINASALPNISQEQLFFNWLEQLIKQQTNPVQEKLSAYDELLTEINKNRLDKKKEISNARETISRIKKEIKDGYSKRFLKIPLIVNALLKDAYGRFKIFFVNRKINNHKKEQNKITELYDEFKQKRDNELVNDSNYILYKFAISSKNLQEHSKSDKAQHLASIVSNLKPKTVGQPREATWFQSYYSKESSDILNTNFKKPIIKSQSVESQSGASCGYHALYNALKSSKAINGEPVDDMITSWRQRIALKRAGFNQWKNIQNPEDEILSRKLSLDNSDWLEEDELVGLFDHVVKQRVAPRNNITFIPDVYRYKNGRPGLDIDIINELVQVQNKMLQHPEGKYEHVYILGTMSEEHSLRNAHWIAVKQKIENGNVEYSVMDSLSPRDYNDVVDELISLLHIKKDCYRFNPITGSEDERLKKLLQIIEFNELFKERRYAYNNTTKGSDSEKVVVNRIPTKLNELVDEIIQACENLIEETGGKSLYSSSGYIQPLELVAEALSNIKSCHNQEITMKLNPVDSKNLSDGITFKSTRLFVAPQQLELMAELERCIEACYFVFSINV